MPSADLRNRWRFFLEHAGYATPPGRAASALSLARAEILLDEAEGLEAARFVVDWDTEPYDAGDVCTEDEAAEKFRTGECVGPFVVWIELGDDYAGSIGGIVVGAAGEADPYMRVIRAELASEHEDELRQAIGDARDELTDDVDATPAERGWAVAWVAR